MQSININNWNKAVKNSSEIEIMKEPLEKMLEEYNLKEVLSLLVSICNEKVKYFSSQKIYIRNYWKYVAYAKQWKDAEKLINKIASKIEV